MAAEGGWRYRRGWLVGEGKGLGVIGGINILKHNS